MKTWLALGIFMTGFGAAFGAARATGSSATASLLQEEQVAIQIPAPQAPATRSRFSWLSLVWVLLVFVCMMAGCWYFLRFAKKRVGWSGSRRHLIEVMAQVPIAQGKASVAIVRVGSDFVLVGVTPNQVSHLSHLPKLQQQYEEENQLERSSFSEAIAEQAKRLKQGQGAELGV